MFSHNIPPIKVGDPITAEWLNKLVRAIRPQMQPGMWQSETCTLQKPMFSTKRGGGSSTEVKGNLAVVISSASKNGGTGTAVPLDLQLKPTAITDSGDPDFDQAVLDHAKFDFVNAHEYSDIPVGSRIQWFTVHGTQHTIFGDFPVDAAFGLLTDCVVELAQRPGTGALVGGSGNYAPTWDMVVCNEAT